MTAEMLKEYPGLTRESVWYSCPDLIADGLDVVIALARCRTPASSPVDSGSMPMVVCASKSYLAQYGVPRNPADLANHSRWSTASALIMNLN